MRYSVKLTPGKWRPLFRSGDESCLHYSVAVHTFLLSRRFITNECAICVLLKRYLLPMPCDAGNDHVTKMLWADGRSGGCAFLVILPPSAFYCAFLCFCSFFLPDGLCDTSCVALCALLYVCRLWMQHAANVWQRVQAKRLFLSK